MHDNRPIGIFDSGVGGLTVVREIMKEMPNESIVYFGDTARVPYGSKSSETITKFSRQIIRCLVKMDVKAVIIACNTASSNSFDILKSEFDIPIFEMVGYGVSACIQTTKNKITGIIGTEGTIRSKAYERALLKADKTLEIYSKACPLFVPLAEEGWTDNTVAHITAEMYLQELIDKEIDTLILGCTHYPLLINCIERVVGNIKVINPAVYAAKEINLFIDKNRMRCQDTYKPQRLFLVSDNTAKFNRLCRLVLGEHYDAKKIEIDSY